VTHGLRLKINPTFYGGVLDATSGKGGSYAQLPVDFLRIDHARRPHAHALGLLLATHLRWGEHGKPLRYRARILADWGGIPLGRRGGEAAAADTVAETLDELAERDCIGTPVWETAPGRERGLDDFVTVPASAFVRDRWIHRLAPLPAKSPSIMSGADLRSWRETRGLTQEAAATLLGVTARALRDAEKNRRRPSRKLRAAVEAVERDDAATRKKSGASLS